MPSCRGKCEPLIQRTALVDLEVAEAGPAYARRIEDFRHGFSHSVEQELLAGVPEERLLIPDQKLVYLEIVLGYESRNPETSSAISVIVAICLSPFVLSLQQNKTALDSIGKSTTEEPWLS